MQQQARPRRRARLRVQDRQQQGSGERHYRATRKALTTQSRGPAPLRLRGGPGAPLRTAPSKAPAGANSGTFRLLFASPGRWAATGTPLASTAAFHARGGDAGRRQNENVICPKCLPPVNMVFARQERRKGFRYSESSDICSHRQLRRRDAGGCRCGAGAASVQHCRRPPVCPEGSHPSRIGKGPSRPSPTRPIRGA